MVTKLMKRPSRYQSSFCSSEKINGNKTYWICIETVMKFCSSEKINGNKTCYVVTSSDAWFCSSEKINGNKTGVR